MIGNAVKVMRILTGEEPEDFGDAPAKDQAAVEMGRKGGRKLNVELKGSYYFFFSRATILIGRKT